MYARRGFTLVEAMITVAIIGILASVAVPFYEVAQARAKASEVPANLGGIVTAEVAYEAANDSYLWTVGRPAATGWRADWTVSQAVPRHAARRQHADPATDHGLHRSRRHRVRPRHRWEH